MKLVFAVFLAMYSASAQKYKANLQCNYSITNFSAPVGEVYTCKARLFSETTIKVEAVSQNHMAGKTNQDVKMLLLEDDWVLDEFPTNIGAFFGNLEGIRLKKVSITELTKNGLMHLPKLKYFSATNIDSLQRIYGDAFVNSPQLEYLDLSNNEITNVGPRLLLGLNKLAYASFSNNLCINVTTNVVDKNAISNQLSFKCPPSVHMIEEIILSGEEFVKSVNRTMNSTNAVITCRLTQVENVTENLTKNVTLGMQQILELKQDYQRFSDFLDEQASSACCAQTQIDGMNDRVKSLEGGQGVVQDVQQQTQQLDKDLKSLTQRVQTCEQKFSDLCSSQGICF